MLSDAWVFSLVQPGLAADHGCSGKTAAGKRYDLTDCYVCHGRLGSKIAEQDVPALVIIEGLTMYLSEADVKRIFAVISKRFPESCCAG